jgi:hypothetical protein
MDRVAFAGSCFLLNKTATSADFDARPTANSGLEHHPPLFFYEAQIHILTDNA